MIKQLELPLGNELSIDTSFAKIGHSENSNFIMILELKID